ncbi:MAG: AAA family ATPase [Blastocatellia bacterium]|nr:AAA family ATPase [Blastocatellia bacterium]
MITRIEIDGFKTFSNFHMDFAPLTVIAGANAAGKSNLFDALHLLSRLVTAENVNRAFADMRGKPIELFTQYADGTYADEMSFAVELLLDKNVQDDWGEKITLTYTRLRYEVTIKRMINRGFEELFVSKEALFSLTADKDGWIEPFISKESRPSFCPSLEIALQSHQFIKHQLLPNGLTQVSRNDVKGQPSEMRFLGLIARTFLQSSSEWPHLAAVKEELRNWKVLQLNPEKLRKPSPRYSESHLDHEGGNLAAVLHRIKLEDPDALPFITRKVNSLLPKLIELNIFDDEAGDQYVVKVRQSDGPEFYARVLSEGTLRMLALCTLLYDESHRGTLCLEEPENGVHPFRMKAIAQLLQDLATDFSEPDFPLRQVIVNTHSPVLLNEIFQLDKKRTLCWFFEFVASVGQENGKRHKKRVTRALPVANDELPELSRFPSEFEKTLSLREVRGFLTSTDFETTLSELEP